MDDIIKQERHKLHMAADNIKQMLQVIEERDESHFFWAWMQLEANLSAAKQCFIGSSKEFCNKINKLFKKHKNTLKKRDELHKILMDNPKMEALTDEDLKEISKGLKSLLKDLYEMFGLEEFQE